MIYTEHGKRAKFLLIIFNNAPSMPHPLLVKRSEMIINFRCQNNFRSII